MKCPLCAHEGIDENTTICPACKADLTAYSAVGKLEKTLKKQKSTSLIFIILFLIALLACVAIFFFTGMNECSEENQKLEQCEAVTAEQAGDIQKLKQELSDLQAENKRLSDELALKKPASVTHVIRYGETLYSIARNFYNDGKMYQKLAEDNGIKDPDYILAGDTIIINL